MNQHNRVATDPRAAEAGQGQVQLKDETGLQSKWQP